MQFWVQNNWFYLSEIIFPIEQFRKHQCILFEYFASDDIDFLVYVFIEECIGLAILILFSLYFNSSLLNLN